MNTNPIVEISTDSTQFVACKAEDEKQRHALFNGRWAGMDNKHTELSRRKLLQASAALAVLTQLPDQASAVQPSVTERPLSRRRSFGSPLKDQASHDYRSSLQQHGGKLSSPPHELRAASVNKEVLDVVVIGSGYGGAITAARLAQRIRQPSRIAVLERGREWIPGTFPDSLPQVMDQLRYGFLGKRAQERTRNQLGLFEYSFNDDINVVTGSGLGGTSLVNANVAAIPEADVFAQDAWPTALRDPEQLQPYFDLAGLELNLQSIDKHTGKSAAFSRIADAWVRSGASLYSNKLAVTSKLNTLREDGTNRQGMLQRACTQCGDCTTGCNVGAKNTLQMNYLPLARQHGAAMYSQTEVHRVEKTDAGYRVHFTQYAADLDNTPYSGSVHAKIVVVAAGSLGSTGILLRSQHAGLSISHHIGQQFSGNGNVMGIMVRGNQPSNSAGVGAYATTVSPVGVAQQMSLDLRHHESLQHRMIVQEGSVPRAYANVTGTMLRDVKLSHSLLFFATGHDAANGRIVLRDGRPRVVWPDHGNDGYREHARQLVRSLSPLGGGRHKQLAIAGDRPSTVHPLGGCPMNDDPTRGVVNDAGEVFDTEEHNATHTHQGLYVADGSVIPTALGSNPFFTIAALSERIADKITENPQFAELFPRAA